MDTQQDIFSNELKIDAAARMQIRGLASWAMVIVVVTVVGYALNIIELVIGNNNTEALVQPEGFSAKILAGQQDVTGTVITILVGLTVNYFLYRFARLVNTGIAGMSAEKLGRSFRNLKIYFAITSIFMMLVLLLLLIVAVVIL